MKNLLSRFWMLWSAMALETTCAWGQSQVPSTIKIITPFTVGTGYDTAARAVGNRLAEKWGTSVIVQNMPGAGSVKLAHWLMEAAPKDGPDGDKFQGRRANLKATEALFNTAGFGDFYNEHVDKQADFCSTSGSNKENMLNFCFSMEIGQGRIAAWIGDTDMNNASHAGCLRRRNAQGPGHALRVQAEQLADAVKALDTPLDAGLKARLDTLTHEYRFGDHIQ